MTRGIELEEELRNRAQSLKQSNEKLEEIIHIISHFATGMLLFYLVDQ